MSILLSTETSWMFFNLHKKITLPDFQLIIITVKIQVTVLSRFHEIHLVGASPHMGKLDSFFKQSVQ